MASINASVAAGNNGVCGPTKALIDAGASLPYAAVTGDLAGNDFSANKTTALRHSVAGTQGGAVALKSEVYSETMCLRTAYAGQDGDTGREANLSDTART